MERSGSCTCSHRPAFSSRRRDSQATLATLPTLAVEYWSGVTAVMTDLDPREFTGVLRGLRQCRKFTDERIADDVLQDILGVARWTGSSKNSQPWHFVVVRDKELLAQVAEAGAFSGFLAGADVVIVIVLDGKGPLGETYDEGRVSERIMLAADAYGLGSGTGWFSTPEAWDTVKRVLGIPAGLVTHSAVGLGYPDRTVSEPARAGGGRRPLSEIVSFDRFGRQN